ncbi:MAG: hypothetical protein RLZZ94_1301 [Bacteroidota bacterium]|jgi:hypothetical protein
MDKIKLLLLFTLFMVGCKSTKTIESDFLKQGYTIVTVLDNRKVDGCQFLLADHNNKRYEPSTLPDSVKVNGLKIGVKFSFIKGGVSVCMGGPLIKVNEIVYLKK